MDTKLEIKPENKKFKSKTKSLDEFAVALALGAVVTGKKREQEDDRFYTFFLQADFDIDAKWLEHASKTLCINSVDLCDAMRRAKSVVHSQT